ncbi:efflux RND transporter periplasmic adaptor subunit [Anaerosporomusa subterranea]|nr:efflux RND transporter periplasmic adaptor subunit [Anaerosporomusa subterranea]
MGEQMVSGNRGLKRRWLLALLTISIIAGAWWFWSNRQIAQKAIAPVTADKRVLAEGIVFPIKYAQMVMPVDGTVGEVLVSEGAKVKANQPLLRLVRQDYQARVGSSRSDLARSAATVEQARVNLFDAQRELQRQQRLESAGATPRQQVDQARTTLERNQAALAQAEADLMTQRSRLTEAEGQLDKTELRAPLDGTVVFIDVKPGEHATLGTVLVRVADESAWEVRSDDLTELTVAKVQVGDAVALTFDGIPGLEIPARVKFIRPYGEKKRGDITYTVTIAPERWDDRLRWNMTAQIAITPSR